MVEKMIKVAVAVGLSAGLALAGGCLTRPVVNQNPTTKTSFEAKVKQQSIDKVDLLFAIDNSASMGDKQDLLAAAVPVLINRLLNPNCVSTNTAQTCKVAGDCSSLGAGAQCDSQGNAGNGLCFLPGDGSNCSTLPNTKAEFTAVHDMHVGIVSSALGGGGSPDICVESSGDPTHQNDKAHLLNRTVGTPEGTVNNAKPVDGNGGNFLAWLPLSDKNNAGKQASDVNVTIYGDAPSQPATQLVTDFKSLVAGVQQHGCGLEAQLESWYRFLVQPDPWDSITQTSDNPPKNQLDGVDATLLKMRKDFLRPDSLVAIVQLTDEEDSWSDPLWLQGYGWTNRTQSFPGGPGQGAGPRGTSECDAPVDINNVATTGPNNPDCTSCAFPGSAKPVSKALIGSDPNCNACAGGQTTCPQKGWYTPASTSTPIAAADGVNVRYSQQLMRPKYGFDSQFAIQRYVDGLRLPTVPDRDHEGDHSGPNNYSASVQRNCTNPLFAEQLPDGSDTSQGALCNLKLGARTPDLVFYAIIGGVSNSLITDTNGNLKLDLTPDDWTKIVGKDPDHYVFDGIDSHMLESTAPRNGLQAPGTSYNLGTDLDNGREWNTLTSSAAIDLQYACTFTLPTPKDCTLPANTNACDCTGTASSAADGPPLCSTSTRTSQIKGKAYPTIRELRVAKGLGTQAVVASLCAKVVSGSTSDPSYGYNGAMQAIVNRLKNALSGQCLPQKLSAKNGEIPCLILVVYPNQTNQKTGCGDPGMSQPDDQTLARYAQSFQASLGDAGAGTPTPVACQFKQLVSGTDYTGLTCEGTANVGWCYVEGAQNTGGCPQAIKFGGSGPPAGTTIDLECIEASGGDGG